MMGHLRKMSTILTPPRPKSELNFIRNWRAYQISQAESRTTTLGLFLDMAMSSAWFLLLLSANLVSGHLLLFEQTREPIKNTRAEQRNILERSRAAAKIARFSGQYRVSGGQSIRCQLFWERKSDIQRKDLSSLVIFATS